MSRDQELRFKVHDGPDYYQLKVSVFTDDKRTDLVGEAWIDLKSIIVPGGGQGDIWQTLTCRGKYAGEIRLEITYYDTRPKPEKPVAKSRPQPAATERENAPVKQRTPMGRRPLPSDPVTGEAPVPPQAPVPASAPAPAPAPVPIQAKAPPLQEQYQTPPRAHAKHLSHSGYVPNHSPLQSVEYQTPPSASRSQLHLDQYSPSPHAQNQPPSWTEPPRQSHRQMDPFESPSRHYDDREYSPRGPVPSYHQPEPRGQPLPEHYDHLPEPRQMPPPMEDDRPPPPPAHRTAYGGPGTEVTHKNSFDAPSQRAVAPMPMRHDVLKNEAHRHSVSAYPPARPTFRPYDSAPPAQNPVPSQDVPGYEPSQPRHHSYDSSYEPHPKSMQPMVEDVPESPTGPYGHNYRRSSSRVPEMGYDYGQNPAPLNLSRSPGASPMRHSPSPQREVSGGYHDQGYDTQPSPSASREFATSPGRGHYNQAPPDRGQYSRYGSEYEDSMQRPSKSSQGLPELPSSLVPGVDPSLSQELAERIQDDRRHDRRYTTQNVGTPPRGRHTSEPPPSYGPGDGGTYGYAPPPPQQPYERRSGTDVTYSSGQEQRMVHSHSTSPTPQSNPQYTIKRKSVSPAPPPAENRRLSDVPFGPDSFDAFNTNISAREDRALVDPDAKIVTHDGREVDPSDHLPVESWAPEPTPKQSKEPSPEPRARPSPSGAQPMPPSSRRLVRTGGRPQNPAALPHPSYGPQDPHTPPSAGRNRLHKKTRSSITGPPAGAGSSPLAPISSENYQDRQGPYATTPTRGGPPRSPNHYDYPNENNAPPHYGAAPAAAPPVPAKVPIGPTMSGANGMAGDDALMQEMQRIDIGAGRSRRRGGY